MSHYEKNPAAVAALVRPDRVHRDVYVSEEIFRLEQKHLFANTWTYVGHTSQVPESGDYVALEVAGRSLVMVRQAGGEIRVLYNRCAHKGTKLVTDPSGNVGKFFRCPYHAWTYALDGRPLSIPLRSGYEATGLGECEAGQGMTVVRHIAVHRDFVFVKIGDGGSAFADHCGPILDSIDNLADRSPVGKLKVEGGVLRTILRCNWKMYLENINDTMHSMSTHESATQSAEAAWKHRPSEEPKPMAIEQILPFGSGYDFFDQMGGRVFSNGHSVLGTRFSVHSAYAPLPEYEAAMRAAYGPERANEILRHSPQNAVLYPSLALKGSPQAIRVIRPLAADRTLVEAWSLRAEGAPEVLYERSRTYNRLIFSPMSIVAHDDAHMFESMQSGLGSDANQWVSLHRDFKSAEVDAGTQDVNGASELFMRNQFRAWSKFMTSNAEL